MKMRKWMDKLQHLTDRTQLLIKKKKKKEYNCEHVSKNLGNTVSGKGLGVGNWV